MGVSSLIILGIFVASPMHVVFLETILALVSRIDPAIYPEMSLE